jgi:hypothetical protein
VVCCHEEKNIRTSVSLLKAPWTRLRSEGCGSSFIPLREFLSVKKFVRKTTELEKVVADVVADGTGYKIKPDLNDGSNRGEMKIVIGVTEDKKLIPYGAWADSSWSGGPASA